MQEKGLNQLELRNLDMQAKLMNRIFSTSKYTNQVRQITLNLREHLSQYSSLESLREQLQNTLNEVLQKVGIFCVSTKFDNFPMWAHYVKDKNGFVVEYDNLQELFMGDNTGVFNELKEVVYYEGKRPAVTLSPSDLTELICSKHIDWSYEREWRVVKLLSKCQKVNVKNRDGKECERHIFKVPNNALERIVKRIIVGWNGNLKEIKQLVSKYNSKIAVVQAEIKDGNIVVPQSV